ncbi:MAG: NnrS family protein [Nitrosomonadales bacterium]|nr:NnrS family protein [Nitrosomonadales bacterium]
MPGFWKNFTAAPHRVMFFGGAVQTLAVMLWWLVELATRSGMFGQPLTWSIAPSAAHTWLMIYGLFPFFMFGFLMTTFPRWMGGSEIPARRFVPAFMLLMLGATGFYVGLFADGRISLAATISMLAGWGMALYALLRVLLDTGHPDKRHPVVLFIALVMGWCGLASYAGWLLTDDASYLNLSIQAGLWFCLLPVFASVGHRMIPFFTGSALPQNVVPRPYWPWWTMLAGSVAHGLLKFADAGAWLWLSDLPLAVAALYLSHVWGFRRSLAVPLLAVLHVGFAWLGIAMLLFGIQSILVSFSPDGTFIWGLAPLHALTIGCFATLIIGMGTRVTLGHSGLPMKVDVPIRLMFAGIQVVALMRMLADILPVQSGYWLYVAAAAVWLACFIPWVLRYLPAYWRPRADGQAG